MNLKLCTLTDLVMGNMSTKFQNNRTKIIATVMAQSWLFLVVFAHFRDFWVTLRSTCRRAFQDFHFKLSLSHIDDPCPLHTSSTTPEMLQGLWDRSARFADF